MATEFPEWQEEAIKILQKTFDQSSNTFKGDIEMIKKSANLVKNKKTMPFVSMMKRNVESLGLEALSRKLEFSEIDALEVNLEYLRRDLSQLKISKVEIVEQKTAMADELDAKKAAEAVPGNPTFRII